MISLAKVRGASKLYKYRGAALIECLMKWYDNTLNVMLDEEECPAFATLVFVYGGGKLGLLSVSEELLYF